MTPQEKAALDDAVFRNTAKNQQFLGFWLNRHMENENLSRQALSKKLGIPGEKLVSLSLCRTPRSDHFAEDVRFVCDHVGAKELVLISLLREEQALIALGEAMKASGEMDDTPTSPEILMAASDREKPEKEEEETKEDKRDD